MHLLKEDNAQISHVLLQTKLLRYCMHWPNTDITSLINELQTVGHEVLVSLNANETPGQDSLHGICHLIEECTLTYLHCLGPTSPPATYKYGVDRKIDDMLGTPALAHNSTYRSHRGWPKIGYKFMFHYHKQVCKESKPERSKENAILGRTLALNEGHPEHEPEIPTSKWRRRIWRYPFRG